jgi:4a-hydroxytetrahydrobiopterin dehydratase
MNELMHKKCIPCSGEVPPLSHEEKNQLLAQIAQWQLIDDERKLYKEFKFKNFKLALAFVNQVSEIAEKEWHHPDINFGWGYCHITIQTHKINNLVESDFILAAKIDQINQ